MIKRLVIIISIGLFALLAFQNCGQMAGTAELSSQSLPPDHPAALPPAPMADSKLVLGDQIYIESVLRDAILPLPDSNEPANFLTLYSTVLENAFTREMVYAQHLLGRGCDPMITGTRAECNFQINNASVKMQADTSAGREAARMQVCLNVLRVDQLVEALARRAQGEFTEPTAEGMRALVGQFYPTLTGDAIGATAAKLMELDSAMKQGGEALRDRWRMAILAVCETPGWEIL